MDAAPVDPSCNPSLSESVKPSTTPSPLLSTPPTSKASVKPSLSESRSKELGILSPSVSPVPSTVSRMPSLSSSRSFASGMPSASVSARTVSVNVVVTGSTSSSSAPEPLSPSSMTESPSISKLSSTLTPTLTTCDRGAEPLTLKDASAETSTVQLPPPLLVTVPAVDVRVTEAGTLVNTKSDKVSEPSPSFRLPTDTVSGCSTP